MTPPLAGRLRGLRKRALGPVVGPLDELARISAAMVEQLDRLERRVARIEDLLAGVDARTLTTAERQFAYEDDHSRLARRVEDIERLLIEE